MQFDRRLMLGVGMLGAGLGAGLAATSARAAEKSPGQRAPGPPALAGELGVAPDTGSDQTARMQAAIDKAAERGAELVLAPGRYLVRGIELRPGSRIVGTPGATIIRHTGGAAAFRATGGKGIALDGLTIEGGGPLGKATKALIEIAGALDLTIREVAVVGSGAHGIALERSSGRVTACRLAGAAWAGLFSIDATGLEISHNLVEGCANNGILVWRSASGDDGTIVAMNRIRKIGAAGGGSGQNGNGINVFRAGGVIAEGNRIEDCAYSGVRANSASDIQMVGNSLARMGETALYAEFAFEGAVIASNLVDRAAVGVSVTNFNEGGRLAAIQGNLVRNLFQRPGELATSGIGIAVEADAAVSGNVIEGAPTAGLMIGWGRYQRDVAATGNVIRSAGVGIAVTGDERAGAVMISSNMISGAKSGAIRQMDHGRPTGGDLAVAAAGVPAPSRIRASGNVVA